MNCGQLEGADFKSDVCQLVEYAVSIFLETYFRDEWNV